MVYVFLANGFEEIEALAVVDVLRRAELDVRTVGVGEDFVIGSHQIPVAADIYERDIVLDETVEAILLPGGMPGTINLEKSPVVGKAIDFAYENGKLICAICAAPSILGHLGMLKGRKATCFPGFETELEGADYTATHTETDGKVITAKGAGCAVEFGHAIVTAVLSKKTADSVIEAMQCL